MDEFLKNTAAEYLTKDNIKTSLDIKKNLENDTQIIKNVNNPTSPRNILNSMSPRTLMTTINNLSPDKLEIINNKLKESKIQENKNTDVNKEIITLKNDNQKENLKNITKNNLLQNNTSKTSIQNIKKRYSRMRNNEMYGGNKSEDEEGEEEEDDEEEENEGSEDVDVDVDIEEEGDGEESKSEDKVQGKNKDDSNIESILKNNNYFIQERLIMNVIINGVQKNAVFFIKCMCPRGNIVFVDLDIQGDINVYEDDIILHEDKLNLVISNSVKSGIKSIIQNNMRGVILDCSYGYYVFIKEETKIIEKNFLYSTNCQKINCDYIYPFPIVRLSDIIEEPETSLDIIDYFHKKYTEIIYNKYNNILIKFDDEVDKLKKLFPNFSSVEINAKDELFNTINTLKIALEKNLEASKDFGNKKGSEKYDLIIFNIQERFNRFIELLKIYEYIDDSTNKIIEINNNILMFKNFIKDNFSNLNKIFIK